MELKPYKKLTGLEINLSKSVQYTEEWIQQLSSTQFLVGNTLEGTLTSAIAGISFDHKLGKQPLGWLLLDQDDSASIWRISWDDKTITFGSTATVGVKIWIF